MKNLVWINWLMDNPIVMWSILGLIIVLPIIIITVVSIANRG